MRYVIVTPVYNEGKYIEILLQSVLKQTILPEEWIIVNDGSTDNTADIIIPFCKEYTWIKLINKEKSQAPFGANVVENFNIGFNKLSSMDWQFVVKLDGDLNILRKDHFEYQLNKMNEDPTLGITSGITFYIDGSGKKRIVWHPSWRTTGAMKLYRRTCFYQIGGLVPVFGWDGIDEYKAMFNGWKTRTFYELEVNHLAKHVSFARKNSKYYTSKGESIYLRGFPIEFAFLKTLVWVFKGKLLVGRAFWLGYIKSYLNKTPILVTPEEKKFIRSFQYRRLLGKIK